MDSAPTLPFLTLPFRPLDALLRDADELEARLDDVMLERARITQMRAVLYGEVAGSTQLALNDVDVSVPHLAQLIEQHTGKRYHEQAVRNAVNGSGQSWGLIRIIAGVITALNNGEIER